MEILELKIFTKKINEQEDFYKNVLGFDCSRPSLSTLKIRAGRTQLILEEKENPEFYHFAFLIPTGAIPSAIKFLEIRDIPLLPLNGKKIIEFDHANAIYFYDFNGNIVEFIERPLLDYPKSLIFNVNEVIKINEIGLPVDNPIGTASTLTNQYGIQPYPNAPMSDRFCWVGDHNGAIIVILEGRNWLPTLKPSVNNDFSIDYREADKEYHIQIVDGKFL